MTYSGARFSATFRSLERTIRRAVKSEWRKAKIPSLKSQSRTHGRWHDGPRGTYFITSEKGIFRCDAAGIHQVTDIHLYGCAIANSRVFMGLHIDHDAFLVEGNAEGLFKADVPFELRVIFREFTSTTHERLHQITSHGDTVWAARTAAGSVLRYDTRTRSLSNITLLRDRFGMPIKRDVNHINSVTQYGDVILFAGYYAGNRSIIGILDGTTVTGFGYKNVGVHDIYLTKSGFLFFDTFGPGAGQGGLPVTERGVLHPEIFAKPPGYVLRGAAQRGDELLIGSSHKGERTRRFKGHGQLLIFEKGEVRAIKTLPCAQVYQIINADGGMLSQPADPPGAGAVRAMLERSLGPPIYEGEAEINDERVEQA